MTSPPRPIHRRHPHLSHASRLAISLLVTLAVGWAISAMPARATTNAGSVQIIDPDTSAPLNSGGSQTLYALALPSGARCPGDSAHVGYHVISYLVPVAVSPGSVKLVQEDPSPGLPLIAENAPFEVKNTAVNTGAINPLPGNFSWSRWRPAILLPGGASTATWNMGIACANPQGEVTTYWNTEVVLKASRIDPGGFTWGVLHPVSGGHTKLWAIGLIVFAVIGGCVLWVTGRSRADRVVA